jgi:signal transduction histidine kinase
MAGSFRAELVKNSREPIDLYEVSLDTARIGDQNEDKHYINYIQALLAGRKLDLIVPIGAPAAFFLQRNRAQLFPTTPMLIVGADARRIPKNSLTSNDAAVVLNLDLPAYLENILRLLPETKNIAVVVGNSPVERYWTSELKRDFQKFSDRVNITWFNDLTFSEMLTHAATMLPQSALFYFLLSEDAAGVPYAQGRALESFREVASGPVFGMGDYQLARGIVGGPLMQTQVLGRQAAELAIQILKGETPGTLKSEPVLFGASSYDARELRRWNISEALLPQGSIVHFREPTVWQQYRWHIFGILVVVFAQAIIIVWSFFEHRRRQIAERELRRRLLEVMHLNRTATAGALSASIAHELNQPLGAIQNYAEAAELHLKANPPNIARVAQILANIRQDDQRAAEIITHFRQLLKKTDAAELREFDVNDVVRNVLRIIDSEAVKRGVALGAHHAASILPVRADQVHLQQVILNLAMNGMDAMQDCAPGASRMSIQTALSGDSEVEVMVADSGTGIPADKLADVFDTFYTTKKHGTGLGLSIARTIVESYGGRIWAENRHGGGAVFRFILPLSKEAVA